MKGNVSQGTLGPVAVVGPGRAGRALAYAWRAAGVPVPLVVGRRIEAAAALAQAVGARAVTWDGLLREDCPSPWPRVWVLAVPDRLVGEVAAQLADRWPSWTANLRGSAPGPVHVLHLSGALGLEPLAPLARWGAVAEVFHPLIALTGRPADGERLRGVRITVIHRPPGEPVGPRLAAALGALPVVWPDPSARQLALYHAAATLAANAVTALFWAAEELLDRAGYPKDHRRPAVGALAAGAVSQSLALGPLQALTGPIVRGDALTVRKHLEALAADEPSLAGRADARAAAGHQPGPGMLEAYRWAAQLVLAAARAARAAQREAAGPGSGGLGRPGSPPGPSRQPGDGGAPQAPAGSSGGDDPWEVMGRWLAGP